MKIERQNCRQLCFLLVKKTKASAMQTPFVKNEPDIAFKEQFLSPVCTSVQPFNKVQDHISTSTQTKNENGKRPLQPKAFQRCKKRKKIAKRPVYFEGCQPVMILNEYYKNLQFTYQTETSNSTKSKFICSVTIDTKDPATNQTILRKFQGIGISKKNAKKECCNQALNKLFPSSYQGPDRIFPEKELGEELVDPRLCNNLKRLTEIRRRISKLVTPQTIQIKSPSQILHELSAKIAENGIFAEQISTIPDKKFCFKISNISDESLINLNPNEQQTIIAIGYGKISNFFRLNFILS